MANPSSIVRVTMPMCNVGYWSLNSFYGFITYVPCSGIYDDYYGYRFYSFNTLDLVYSNRSQSSAITFPTNSYPTNSQTSSGTSGTISSGSPASTTSDSVNSSPINRSSGQADGRTK